MMDSQAVPGICAADEPIQTGMAPAEAWWGMRQPAEQAWVMTVPSRTVETALANPRCGPSRRQARSGIRAFPASLGWPSPARGTWPVVPGLYVLSGSWPLGDRGMPPATLPGSERHGLVFSGHRHRDTRLHTRGNPRPSGVLPPRTPQHRVRGSLVPGRHRVNCRARQSTAAGSASWASTAPAAGWPASAATSPAGGWPVCP